MPSPNRSARTLALAAFLVATAATTPVLAEPPPADADAPVTAGQMSEEAARAKRLFDGQRWGEAATALKRVIDGDMDDDEGNRQIAQLRLAVSLYRLRFHHASIEILADIARRPNHLKYNEALRWLVKLAMELPEEAGVVEILARRRIDPATIRSCAPQEREVCWQLDYLLGRYKYQNRNFEEAVSLFDRIGAGSRYAIPAKLLLGFAHLKLGRADVARGDFEEAARAVEGSAEQGHLAPFVQHAIACTYFTAALPRPRRRAPRWACERLDRWL
jgi:tetratricopeptide (TPR) repeat protein